MLLFRICLVRMSGCPFGIGQLHFFVSNRCCSQSAEHDHQNQAQQDNQNNLTSNPFISEIGRCSLPGYDSYGLCVRQCNGML